MISTGFESSGCLLKASGKRKKEVHTGSRDCRILRPAPLNSTMRIQGLSCKNVLGLGVGVKKLESSHLHPGFWF